MFLFDSGARIEEALNVRLSDITKSSDGKFHLVHLRGTKTEEADRKIALPISTDFINDWLQSHPSGDSGDFLFPIRYDNARKIIKEMSSKHLGVKLRPHELRHSSATYYVALFGAENIVGFYYRYGWKFGSNDANTYIKRHLYGGDQGQRRIVNSVESSKVTELEKEMRELRNELDLIKRGKGFMRLLLSLKKDQEEMTSSLEEHTATPFDVVLRERDSSTKSDF